MNIKIIGGQKHTRLDPIQRDRVGEGKLPISWRCSLFRWHDWRRAKVFPAQNYNLLGGECSICGHRRLVRKWDGRVGTMFPPDHPRYEGKSERIVLLEAAQWVCEAPHGKNQVKVVRI